MQRKSYHRVRNIRSRTGARTWDLRTTVPTFFRLAYPADTIKLSTCLNRFVPNLQVLSRHAEKLTFKISHAHRHAPGLTLGHTISQVKTMTSHIRDRSRGLRTTIPALYRLSSSAATPSHPALV